jgi:hypothetical protein
MTDHDGIAEAIYNELVDKARITKFKPWGV